MIPLDPVVESYPASELHSLTFSARYSPPIRVVDSLSDPKIAGLNTKRRASERASVARVYQAWLTQGYTRDLEPLIGSLRDSFHGFSLSPSLPRGVPPLAAPVSQHPACLPRPRKITEIGSLNQASSPSSSPPRRSCLLLRKMKRSGRQTGDKRLASFDTRLPFVKIRGR